MENFAIVLDELSIGAKWWADKLRSGKRPTRNYVSDPNQVDGLEYAFMQLSAQKPNFSDEQIGKFERSLIIEMAHRIEVYKNKIHFHLGCDYHPDETIEAAAVAADMGDLTDYLPLKTNMHIRRGIVTVSEGYRAKPVHLMGYEKALRKYDVAKKLWVKDTNQFRTSRISKLYPSEVEEFEGKTIEEQYPLWFGGAPIKATR